MEARFERDEIQRELKRVQRDIQALRDEENEDPRDFASPFKLATTEVLVNELIKSSEVELGETTKTRWDLPLPVPAELETEEKMDELLQICEESLGGLKVQSIKRGAAASSWELTGSAGIIEFTIGFSTAQEGERTIVRNFELKRIPHECVQEINPLMELARSRSCVRTWLLGMSEYAFLVQEREACFAEIRSKAPHHSCLDPERRVQSFLDAVADDRQRTIRLVWRADWTVMPDSDEPNEFLRPICELIPVRGFEENVEKMIADPEAFAGLARKHGVAGAMLTIIRKLYE